MKTLVAVYHSTDKDDEEYWDVGQTANDFSIEITDTTRTDWGGESIYEVVGSETDLRTFAVDFCGAETLEDLYPSNEKKVA